MTHFICTVKLSEERMAKHKNDLGDALDEMMEPYNEQPEKGSPFLVFTSHEEEWRREYAEEDAETRASYATFDKYAEDYHGGERVNGQWGSTRNPNAKWDWYVIGGRWSGFFPLRADAKQRIGEPGSFRNEPKPGCGDIVRANEIDIDTVNAQALEAARKFHAEYERFLSGAEFAPFDGPRSRALDLGLLRIERDPNVIVEDSIVIPWSKYTDDDRRLWRDVCKPIALSEVEKLVDCFNPIVGYAALDDNGWHSPGRMGWFGCSDETPEAYRAWKTGYVDRFIRSAKATDLLVAVDCHI